MTMPLKKTSQLKKFLWGMGLALPIAAILDYLLNLHPVLLVAFLIPINSGILFLLETKTTVLDIKIKIEPK